MHERVAAQRRHSSCLLRVACHLRVRPICCVLVDMASDLHLEPYDKRPLAGHPPAPRSPFEGVEGRSTLDNALRTVQQAQTQLSAMADTKASIMITVCSIVLTVGITRFQEPLLRWPLVLLAASTFGALLFAILTVLPSTAQRSPGGGVDVNAPWFNLFFFGHFTELPRDRFEALLAEVAHDDSRLYWMLARDIYGQGMVLARKKYRMLRWSYLVFLVGLGVTALAALVTTIFLA